MLLPITVVLYLAQHALIVSALPPTRRQVTAPAQYTANPKIGGGGTTYRESAHFRVYGATSTSIADSTLKILEAAHQCFVEGPGWRTPGLSIKTGGVGKEVGPWYKTNVYAVPASFMPGSAGQQGTDTNAGLPYLNVVHEYVNNAAVVVHEFGHCMHYSEKNWVNQGRYVNPIRLRLAVLIQRQQNRCMVGTHRKLHRGPLRRHAHLRQGQVSSWSPYERQHRHQPTKSHWR